MNKDKIFKLVQEYLSDTPLLLVGTGGTIPYGLPGMKELAEFLISNLDQKYNRNKKWNSFVKNLRMCKDLESALSDVNLPNNIINEIVRETWKLISSKDLDLFYKTLEEKKPFPIGDLIKKYYNLHPQVISIITTNYDRVIEYACDQMNIGVDTQFCGQYFKSFCGDTEKTKKIVKLLKVHGSIDWFEDKDKIINSIPLQSEIPLGLTPKIITPGLSKYQNILQDPFRTVLANSDGFIINAKNYLCIGYGFNDEQIQAKIISEVRKGKPIVIVTRQMSDKAYKLIADNAKKYIIIQESQTEAHSTEFIVDDGSNVVVNDNYWSVNGFLKILG